MKSNQILCGVVGVIVRVFRNIFWEYAIMDEVIMNFASFIGEFWCVIFREGHEVFRVWPIFEQVYHGARFSF